MRSRNSDRIRPRAAQAPRPPHLRRSGALRRICILWVLAAVGTAFAADLQVPAQAIAGQPITITTTGSGEATFYLIGPVARRKQKIRLGKPVSLTAQDTHQAGRYMAIVKSGNGVISRVFFVVAAQAADVSFLAQPSRVPAGTHQVISGTAFLTDPFRNLVIASAPVKFNLSVEGTAPLTRTVLSRDGVAWTRMDSSPRAGAAQFTATVGDVSVRRVVQQTAAEPCHLRMKATPAKNGILVETDPVRDCSGNPVPDGTIISFSAVDPSGRNTVDAVLKHGIARAELPAASWATISVASGVVIGNEIHWGGRQ